MPEERLKLAVFIDFDNIQIGVKDTLGKDFDVSLVLESLKERGEVVAKVAYGDWSRAGDQSRQMTQHAIQMVQRSVTPRGDKNGADINLALDALEMAFTRHHVTAFAIVGGDSDFMALVEKLKQFDKQVFVIGGRAFTSNILQRNCTEFIAYENLLKGGGADGRPVRSVRRSDAIARVVSETRALSEAFPNIQRAIKILADRGVSPQLGLLKSTLLQLDSTFSERDYGAGSFLEFMQKVEGAGLAHLHRTEGGYLVELPEGDSQAKPASEGPEPVAEHLETNAAVAGEPAEAQPQPAAPDPAALSVLKKAVAEALEKSPGRPLYLRQIRQRMRAIDPNFDERRYGYRGTLDLLHHAQREGWLKVMRDHKGVWRVHPVAAPPESISSSATAVVPAVLVEVTPMAGEVSVTTSVQPSPEAAAEEPAPWDPASEEAEPIPEVVQASSEVLSVEQPQPKPKPRRTRAAKGPAKETRRTSVRQKAKSSKHKAESSSLGLLGFPEAEP
ncbi:MAG TPA: NYN domain-containing protein [Terriglobia bacterium]|nr:NYN domain-containing protein [Terriglobia bacterium]